MNKSKNKPKESPDMLQFNAESYEIEALVLDYNPEDGYCEVTLKMGSKKIDGFVFTKKSALAVSNWLKKVADSL